MLSLTAAPCLGWTVPTFWALPSFVSSGCQWGPLCTVVRFWALGSLLMLPQKEVVIMVTLRVSASCDRRRSSQRKGLGNASCSCSGVNGTDGAMNRTAQRMRLCSQANPQAQAWWPELLGPAVRAVQPCLTGLLPTGPLTILPVAPGSPLLFCGPIYIQELGLGPEFLAARVFERMTTLGPGREAARGWW